MGFSDRLVKFNRPDFLPEGWFWLMTSAELKRGQAKSAELVGKPLAVYRGADGRVRALDAHCPHMGAHLGDGIVEGDGLRCLFHNWKFSGDGKCADIPCQKSTQNVPSLGSYRVEERHGLIWLWTGALDTADADEIPVPPELKGLETTSTLGTPFVKNCHPNVVMVNAIDAHHFNTVHKLVLDLNMQSSVTSEHAIRFRNITPIPRTSALTRFFARFYAGAGTYDMTYWFGHTGSVTLGPDFMHFYILFALRPTLDGKTEGQTVLITRRREGLFGSLANRAILALTKIVGNYFAKGDTVIFSKIKFDFKTPIAADRPIVEFIQHYERQPAASAFARPALQAGPRSAAVAIERNAPSAEL